MALALGIPVSELLNRISSHELSEWQAYSILEPFGEGTAFLRTGIIASTIANVNRGKNSKMLGPEDFIPKFGEVEKKEKMQSFEEQLSVLQQIAEEK